MLTRPVRAVHWIVSFSRKHDPVACLQLVPLQLLPKLTLNLILMLFEHRIRIVSLWALQNELYADEAISSTREGIHAH